MTPNATIRVTPGRVELDMDGIGRGGELYTSVPGFAPESLELALGRAVRRALDAGCVAVRLADERGEARGR